METAQGGMGTAKAFLIVLGIAALGIGAWYVSGVGRVRDTSTKSNGSESRVEERARQESSAASPNKSTKTAGASGVTWSFDGSNWQPSGTPPACPEPLALKAPVDLTKTTSILYPGQPRGGQYKPHGGFRFADNTNASVTVTAPLDATLVQASQYLEQGEVQYLLEFVAPCGLMYRFDHLLALAPAMKTAVAALPAPKPDDSRTTNVNPPVAVQAGDTLGTAVGFESTGNTSVDFGVYDLRQANGASGLPADDRQLAPFAVCWFDMLSAADEAKIRSLPAADATAGKSSDYCK